MAAYKIGGGPFRPLLGGGVEGPQAKALTPAAFPFEVVDQRPMEIGLHLPIEVHGAPDLVKVLRDVAPADGVVRELDAVLGDDDGQVRIGADSPMN